VEAASIGPAGIDQAGPALFSAFFFTAASRRPSRQASEQYRTDSQSRAHFFRQAKGRPQAAQTFSGRLGLRCAIL